ncbi:sensor histidine kinase [Nocardia puris]|uniref:histidine kinase n=1 Tax=Nocardia puris TaxID=208602 RepID=A0A366E285_9NOCA|nr:sensor histidine kinase [Nocardia puris]MBF6209502.1 sensor histidine kinase [Nocardia puris]MBF6366074.1 sensor histidine kinase [Nocardia puris]MBF6458585.1 sensor histidine kinase [Nocardia puris]RBO96235.1 signal transduction histidine kinase [Nocardia puris]
MSDTEPMRRNQAVDLALAMTTLVVVGTAITANVGAGEVNPTAYLFGALFGGLMLVRRRWPVGTLLVSGVALLGYYMLDYPPIGLALPVAAALFSAAERGRLSWAIGTALALLGISTAVRVGQGDNLGFVLGLELPTSAGLMAAMIALGDSVRARRGWRAESAARERAVTAEHELELAGRLEQERLRVARDLHDLLAHTVSVIALHTDVARESLREDPATAERSLTAARTACRDAGRELRATVDALRASGATAPPAPDLRRLAELVAPAETAGRTVTIERSPSTTELPAIVDLTAYRVIQESLSNILRHSDAGTVHLEIDRDDTDLVVRVTDDGTVSPGSADQPHATDRNTSPNPGAGWGIIGMRERVTLLGGTLDAGHRREGGFRVEARIPLRGRR